MTELHILTLFLHGLIFTALSLTVAFLKYRSRRILIARRLSWLGAFALCESIVAWNDLLAPLLTGGALLPPLLRVAVLTGGYAYLLAFGVQTFFPKEIEPLKLRYLLLGVQLGWSIPYLLTLLFTFRLGSDVAPVIEILARYLLAAPGGVLAGFGIRRQSYQTLNKDWRSRIRPYLRLIEAASGAFGLLQLVLVPKATFLPAYYLNETCLPFSPQLLWALVGWFWLWGIVRSLTIVQTEIEQWIENVEHLQALTADRERIGRELHDGVIQSIYAAGLMLEGVQHQITTHPQRAQGQINRILKNLNQTIHDIRRYIFDLHSDLPDDDLETGLRRLLRDFKINTLLETELLVTGEPGGHFNIERRRHLFQITRETLTNTARHAAAKQVSISLVYQPENIELLIMDDGIGMQSLHLRKGYGLRNIRERARLVDSKLKIDSAPNQGMTLHLTVPYN
ncbi:MAG: histidine kinase [Chloroflexota bacterium]|nr:histidine kinase [Chloroflexota bacterium]